MRRRLLCHLVASALPAAGVLSCAAPAPPSAAHAAMAMSPGGGTGLILQEGEGERRVRRNAGKGPFILKVDRRNGGSPDLVMGYEDIAPGAEIQRHMHLVSDEILFIHRGSGLVNLGDREAKVGAGGTVYIPRNVPIRVRNTGTEPLGVAFIFSKPGFEELMRENSVPEGQPVTPISPEEREQIRKRNSWHTVTPPR